MAPHLSKTGQIIRGRNRSYRHANRTPYNIVTERIVKALEAGVVPWRKPWQENTALPCNAISQRPYHGINLILLSLARYSDHRWLTYRQAEELSGHVRSGEHSSIAIFWKKWEPVKDEEGKDKKERERIPLLRYYHLFNVQQCQGLSLPELEVTTRHQHERIDAAEALVNSIPDPPRLHKGCKYACYYPVLDIVQIPPLDSFETPDAYYATLFHELGHATGHETRLNRKEVTLRPRFGSGDYSREELVAELTSAFCCANVGLDNSLVDNSASYIQGWVSALKVDPKAIVSASAQAQRAADYLQGRCVNRQELDLNASADRMGATP